MARIYVTEPGHTGGVGAMGMRILVDSLRSCGHDVTRVRLFKHRRGEAGDQMPLLSGGTETVSDAAALPRPDAWFVSTLYPRQWVDIPDMFRRIGLPVLASERKPNDPLVAFGGQSMIAPAPIETFADVLAMGDGEVTGAAIGAMLDAGMTRERIMGDVAGRDGFYVPKYGGILRRIESASVTPRLIRDDEGRGAPVVEVARGCASKCAFCPIGWAGGSYRETASEAVSAIVSASRLRGGKVNLFAPDYSSVSDVPHYEDMLAESGCSSAGRDARMDAAARHLNQGRGGVKAYNFGVEGLSERLRRAIGKPLPNDTIVSLMSRLGVQGVTSVRWYMILGLPTEGDDDMAEFLATVTACRAAFTGRFDITCTHLQAVPHTPLQWIDNRYDTAAIDRGVMLRDHLRELHARDGKVCVASEMKGRELHEHDAWIQRADASASEYLLRLDGSAAKLRDGRWRDIAGRATVDCGLGARDPMAPVPWDHVDVGVAKERVVRGWANYQRIAARTKTETPHPGG